ncbi:DNA modification methyltransferase-related protein [Pseudanabaena sp. lw0831]|uniref:hypothetical protein n=1 Tax=Pseudanabaena sp. lw0831 TaxID=1357935 RepID=UPI001914F839|nr:hypothetical protein [Pseudanabaena sp. lw0831]GBO52609.1 DNA modification methyltransferase-related protein [Pseudanabaena sp. lw0831]
MTVNRENIFQFINFCRSHIQGGERGDAQPFLGGFFKAFAYEGALQAGAKFELPIPKSSLRGNTGFADRDDISSAEILNILSSIYSG